MEDELPFMDEQISFLTQELAIMKEIQITSE